MEGWKDVWMRGWNGESIYGIEHGRVKVYMDKNMEGWKYIYG